MFAKLFQKIDPIITILIIILSFIGLVANYSMTISLIDSQLGAGSFEKQVIFVIVGIILYIIFSNLNISWLSQKPIIYLLFIFNFIFLVLAFRFAPQIAGVRRWFLVGPIQIQISEVSKLALLVLTSYFLSHFFEAKLFSKLKTSGDILKNVVIILILNIVSCLLIALEPSLGIAILILISQFFVIFYFWPYKKALGFLFFVILTFSASIYLIQTNSFSNLELVLGLSLVLVLIFALFKLLKISKVILIISVILGLSLLPSLKYGYENIVNDYQKQRIVAFLNPSEVSKDNTYQQTQAKIAIQNGGIFGMGYLQGEQTKATNHIPNLPYAYTDFVYSGIAEEFGILGAFILLLIFLILILRVIIISQNIENNFFNILTFSIVILFLFQVLMHVAINLGIIANTGIPLPFISYGGSVNLIYFVMFGIVNAVNNNSKIKTFN